MLDERPNEFEERNLFFFALLGLVAALGRLDVVASHPAPAADSVPSADPFLLGVLGIIAFRRRLMSHLDRVEAPPPRPPLPTPADSRPLLREVLR